MHYSAPSHPLIQSFLLQKTEFSGTRKVIVENTEQGEKLFETLTALQEIHHVTTKFRLISSLIDLVEFEHDASIVGIFTPETLEWKIHPKDIERYCLKLESGMKYSEEVFVTWLSEHGYTAKKSDEIGTYFRVGDTISIPVQSGILRVSFFGTTLEELLFE